MVSLLKKTKPDSYPELAKVNHAEIRWKEYVLNWGGLTDAAADKSHDTRSRGVTLAVRSQQRS